MQSEEDELTSAADLPYFEGDYWPFVLEQVIHIYAKETNKKANK